MTATRNPAAIVAAHLSPTTVFSSYVGSGDYIRQLRDPAEIPPVAADVALRTAVAVAEDLGLPRDVTVYFYRPCAADHPDAVRHRSSRVPNGLCTVSSVDEIWIRADLTPAKTRRVVAHELRHAWQNFKGEFNTNRAEREGDARRFENDWAARNS